MKILTYLLRRFLVSATLVWGVLSLTFLLIHLTGDPTAIYLNPQMDEKTLAAIRRQMGFDLSLWQQYFVWLRGFITGHFGFSFVQMRPVSDIFAEALLNTFQLTVVVFGVQLFGGVLLGVCTGIKRRSKLDVMVNSFLLFIYSMPGFWLALIAIMIFSLKLRWLPSSQMQSIVGVEGFWPQLADRIKHLILPVLVLAMPFLAYTTRFVRAGISEVLAQDYIRTVLAFGIRRRKIWFKYALKNALLPLVTIGGLYLPFLLGGAVITEYIFAWPGMGSLTINAIYAHDFPVVLASTFIAALSVIAGNFLADLLYFLADPRIKKPAV